MPRYITPQDVIRAYGETRFALLADTTGTSTVDTETVAAAVIGAEAEVDSYVGHRYAMPLPGIVSNDDPALNTVPENLRFRCVDIAVYRLAKDHDQLTKERRLRYEDAIKWLRMLATFQVELGVDANPSTKHGGAVRFGPERTMQFSQTKGLI